MISLDEARSVLLACQGCHPGSLYERRTAVWLVAVRVWRFPGPPASVGSPDLVDEEVVHLHQFVSATLMRSYSDCHDGTLPNASSCIGSSAYPGMLL